jgi:predicted PurR-regulated permease PerM
MRVLSSCEEQVNPMADTVVQVEETDVQIVHVRGVSAIRRPLIVLAICAVGAIGFLARDFLIPTAAAVVLALMLVPVANAFERARLPSTLAAFVSVLLLTMVLGGLLAVAIPSISDWASEAPMLTRTLEHKLEGVRKSLAFLQELTNKVEQAASTATNQVAQTPEKVVMRERSMLTELATTTPGVLLQVGYTVVLAFMLLAHRNTQRRQILRVAASFDTRVRLARVLRDINERVGHYLFSLAVIYLGVAVAATVVMALLGFPNAIMWGVCMGLASFVPFIGPPAIIVMIGLVGLLTFDEWGRIVAVPALLTVVHFAESQYITPTFVSRRCALNTIAVFVTIAFLGWMWGAIGAIVAVPLLILISTVAAHLPSLRWLEVLLSDDRPVSERLVRPPLASVKRAPKPPRPAPVQRRRRVASK